MPGLARPEPLPESDQRQRLFDAVNRVTATPGAPLLLVADDLQWCDRETLHFLHYLLRAEPEARLLVAATARREDVDPQHPLNDLLTGLHALDRCTEIQLERLTRAETVALVERITERPVAEPDIDRLYAETEGSPLFVVEALRAGWQSGGSERGWLSPKVQAAIQARLAQLSEPARGLVGLAATIGREFTPDALAYASEADQETLVRSLDELWRRRIVREQGTAAYDFSHDKLREVAYLTLGPAQRRHHHFRVASALERLHGQDPGPVSGQLAAHYERAGAIPQAIIWYEQAAEAAQKLHANHEAVRLLNRALDLLRALPEPPERASREMTILAALPAALGMVEGYASSHLADVHRRALELASGLDVDLAPPLLRSLAVASLSRNDFAQAEWFGQQLHARGERDGDDVLLVESEYVLGIAAFWQGEFAAAREHFETAVDRFRPDYRCAHLSQYGMDPKVVCLSRLGNTLWFLGCPESAVRARDAALALAEEIGHPNSQAIALVFAAMLSLDLRDNERVRNYVAKLLTGLGDRTGLPTQFSAEAIAGYIEVVDGRTAVGIARIQQALDATRGAEHAPGMQASIVRVLLEACAVAQDARAGLAVAERAIGMDASVWEAEARRLRAEFLAALDAPAQDIETELERALEVARGQGAKALELRAAVSLLRRQLVRGDDPDVRQARARLAVIVEGLPEGRHSRDLRETETLLGRH